MGSHDGLEDMRSKPNIMPCTHSIHKGGAEALQALEVAQESVWRRRGVTVHSCSTALQEA